MHNAIAFENNNEMKRRNQMRLIIDWCKLTEQMYFVLFLYFVQRKIDSVLRI